MWNDRLRLAERVVGDWEALSPDERTLVREAFRRIDDDPIAGVPLFEPLRGYWSYRTGWLRIVYRIVADARFILVLRVARAEELIS